jgi:HAMP domain-containing protein
MGLKAKFNLVMLAAFAAGLSLAAVVFWNILRENAEREVLQEAGIMTAAATAMRSYTFNEVAPLLEEQMKVRFLPHTVPSWAAQTNLREIEARYPNYRYKEAALNPTNPADRASDWEADIIAQFRRDPALKEFVSSRDSPVGPILSVSRPIQITAPGCLSCHTTARQAPPAMVDLYGSANGFGWKLNEVIGAQIVSVPMQVPMDRAQRVLQITLVGLATIFALMLILLNVLLHYIIVRPVRRIAAAAGDVSMGNMDAPEIQIKGNDEIASLAGSFNRMRRSLANAMKLLGE